MTVSYRQRDTIAMLRKSLEAALKFRKTKVCVIDEAYHLFRLGRDTAVMDTLKSLANTTGVKLVLIGSFDLFDLVSDHGQVARRMTLINFDRYRAENKLDRDEFRSIVGALTDRWPCEERPNLAAIADELLEVTFGCVGLLKSLMLEALGMQLLHNGKWKTDFLAKAAKANALRRVIQKEIEVGEIMVWDAVFGQSLWDKMALKRLEAKMGRQGV